jgi:hypothetical protein
VIFEDIKIPELKSNEEKILLNIIGDVILSNKDSGDIIIKSVRFSEELNEEAKLINGYITLNICENGGSRFLALAPKITAKNNPISELLEIECYVIESGNYTLEIVDLSGSVSKIKDFVVDTKTQNTYNFEIPVAIYSSGNYILLMNTPTMQYTTKFIIKR